MVEKTYAWAIKPEWIVYIPGLVCGLNITCRAIGEPGDAVVTATPVYPPFLSSPALSGRKLITFPLTCTNKQWTFPCDVFEQALTPESKLLLLCSPHNPVGRVFDRQELIDIANVCEKHDLVICSDEIHNGLILDESKPHIPIAALSPEIAARTITLMAPSKTFNVPGLGCSFAIIPNEHLKKQFKKAMAGIVPWVNLLGYSATLAAYRDCADWHIALLNYLRGNRDYVISEIATMPGLTVFPVEATYLAWIDARDTGIDNPADFFEKAGVGLSDGSYFGTPGFLRLNFGCPRSILEEALTRMRNALTNRKF
jgi:cystathionine beta-lyase